MKTYTAKWAEAGQHPLGNVSFQARSDFEAVQKADKIGREIGLPGMARTIQCNGKLIHIKN